MLHMRSKQMQLAFKAMRGLDAPSSRYDKGKRFTW